MFFDDVDWIRKFLNNSKSITMARNTRISNHYDLGQENYSSRGTERKKEYKFTISNKKEIKKNYSVKQWSEDFRDALGRQLDNHINQTEVG